MRDMATGRARGFGFVEMASDEEAQRAISELNEFKMEGRPLVVNEGAAQTRWAVAAAVAAASNAATAAAVVAAADDGSHAGN
jgi:hypothetical protein